LWAVQQPSGFEPDKKERLMKTFTKFLGIIAGVAVIGSVLAGCASSADSLEVGADWGSLTITGIPAEFEGKFAISDMLSIPNRNAAVSLGGSSVVANGKATVITNGEVKLPLYKDAVFSKPKGYIGSDTVFVQLKICDTLEETISALSPTARFEPVTFENGVAEVKWEDAAKAGSITVTGIPDKYNDISATIYSGVSASVLGSLTGNALNSAEASGHGRVQNGTVMAWILGTDKSSKEYTSYTETGVKNIIVAIPNGKFTKIGLLNVPQTDKFLFKDAQVTDGKAALNFKTGVQQE
jgi:hypothetical protein